MSRLLGVLMVGMILVACSDAGSSPTAEGLTVVATTSVLADLTEQILGEEGTVEVVIPAGTDPHDFSPSPRDIGALHDADLVVANGLGLEVGLTDALDDAAEAGVEVVVLGEHIDPRPFDDHGSDHSDDHDPDAHAHGEFDPHFIVDPLRMADAAEVISTALAEVDPSIDWTARAAAVRSELEQLHADIEAELASIDRRKLVTNHESLGYFAERYGFEVVGTVIPGGSTLGEPSAADLSRLADVLRREGVTTIFADISGSTGLAETLATELEHEVTIVRLYTESLGEPGSGAESYVGMMRTNASLIAAALGE